MVLLLIAGSWIINDSRKFGRPKDLDLVLLTWNPGLYALFVRNKSSFEKTLCRKFNIEVTLAPFLLLSPKLMGNLFLALTLSRLKSSSLIFSVARIRIPRRWLLLYSIFGFLGIFSASDVRDVVKYGSIFAESLIILVSKRFPLLPRSWFKTLRLGYALSSKLGLRDHVRLFKEILNAYNSHDVDMDKVALLSIRAFKERLSLFGLNIDDFEARFSRWGLWEELFRFLHEVLFRFLSGKHIFWRCSERAIVHLARLVVVSCNVGLAFRLSIGRSFIRLKNNIPVLSVLAHP